MSVRTFAVIALLALLASAAWIGSSALLAPAAQANVRQAAGLHLALDVLPLERGRWQVDLRARDMFGQPAMLRSVRAHFAMPLICTDEVALELHQVAPGHFRGAQVQFPMSGVWSGALVIQRPRGAPVEARFDVPISLAEELALQAQAPPLAGQDAPAGRLIYLANCASCHGASGLGDGPAGANLNPPPLNLVEHMVPGKHSDAQVFLTISRGRPGTAMRGYAQELSPDQIWQLVAYLRSLSTPQE